jgi:hypothetical protein
MTHTLSRRSLLSSAAAVSAAGAAIGLTATSASATAAANDAVLVEAWTKLCAARDALRRNDGVMAEYYKAALAAADEAMPRPPDFAEWPEAERMALARKRDDLILNYDDGGTGKEQDRLFNIIEPLEAFIASTPATTLDGVGVKAALALDWHDSGLASEDGYRELMTELGFARDGYCELMTELLAGLAAFAPGRQSALFEEPNG